MQKDLTAKQFFDNPNRFCDVVNMIIGRKVLKPEDVRTVSIEEFIERLNIEREDPEYAHLLRDLLKECVIKEDDTGVIVLFGLEIQSSIDPKMPVRVMGYDYSTYLRQLQAITKIRAREKKEHVPYKKRTRYELVPVATITLYMGSKPWNEATSIHEMFGNRDITKYGRLFQNWDMLLISIVQSDEELFDLCEADLKMGFRLIKHQNSREKFNEIMYNENGKNVLPVDVVKLVNAYTKADIPISEEEEREGEVDMCKAMDENRRIWLQEGEERGEKIGELRGLQRGREEGFLQGEKKGIEDTTRMHALRMHDKGVSIADISDFLNVPDNKIENWVRAL